VDFLDKDNILKLDVPVRDFQGVHVTQGTE
jgi:hypothetical protein